jgi:hypothetical protein
VPEWLSSIDFSFIMAFIVPGFVALSVRAQFIAGNIPSANGERFLAYVTVSVIYGTLVLRFVDVTLIQTSVWVYLAVVFGGPLVLGLILGINIQQDLSRRFLSRIGLSTVHPVPTAWDWKFNRGTEEWVLVTLKNGTRFAGFYGPLSFTASILDERDMYIQWVYEIGDDGIWSPAGEQGVLITAGEISTIEFWPYRSEGAIL